LDALGTGLSAFSILGSSLRAIPNIAKSIVWSKKQKKDLGDLGRTFVLFDTIPYRLVQFLHVIFILLFVGLIIRGSSDPLKTMGIEKIDFFLECISNQFYILFLVWIIFVFIDIFSVIPKIALLIGSFFPTLKNSLGWANAALHAKFGESASAYSLCDKDYLRAKGNEVLKSFIAQPENVNRAIRPNNLTNETAANILFIGHTIESQLRSYNTYKTETEWTQFYKELANLSLRDENLFSKKYMQSKNWVDDSFSNNLISRLDDASALKVIFNNEPFIQEVDKAVTQLIKLFKGDALLMASSISGKSYKKLNQSLAKFPQFNDIDMRQQYLKLAIIWKLFPSAKLPKRFASSFNFGIARLLLTKDILRTNSKSIDCGSQEFKLCYNIALVDLIAETQNLAKKSNTPIIKQWYNEKIEVAKASQIQEEWYVAYRIDQHIYHMGRSLTDANWNIERASNRLIVNG